MARRRRGSPYKCVFIACTLVIAIILLFGSIYIVALQLHRNRTEAKWTHGLGHIASSNRTAAFPHMMTRTQTRWKRSPFALIPRPRRIQPIDIQGSPQQCDDGVHFWWHAVLRADIDQEIQAALKAYTGIIESQPQKLHSSRGDVPACAMTVTLHSTISDAGQYCTSHLTSLAQTPPVMALPVSAEVESEWHMAVLHESRLVVCAITPQGAFRFASTLQQMLHAGLANYSNGDTRGERFSRFVLSSAPFLLEDWPAFTWRGLHLDTVRHFMPIAFLKRYLQAMAFYKANVFHWHLTDDQAWRPFLPSRPKLVNASARTSPGFYELNEVRELVKFASDLFITIVPGIETPGHSLAALAAYPELACVGDHFVTPKGREGVYEDILCAMTSATTSFAKDVFADVAKLFPAKFVHIGGDEAPSTRWKQSAELRNYAQKKQFRNFDVDVFEAWLCLVTQILRTHDRIPIIWDDHFSKRQDASEKCPHAEQDWVVQAWLLAPPLGASTRNQVMPDFPFRTIASPYNQVYLDQPVGTINFSHAASFFPGKPSSKLLGGCATMWTEHIESDDVPARVYPRYLGVANNLWGAPLAEQQDRCIDMLLMDAAVKHCENRGPLKQDFGFSCGKFHLPFSSGPNKVWYQANVKTNMQIWANEYSPERAVDGDQDTYFWAVSPKATQTFRVGWLQDHSDSQGLGRWLCRITILTGSRDRPNDTLENADVRLLQWVPLDGRFGLRWAKVAQLKDGRATISNEILEQGPVLALKLVVTADQIKWMTISEIVAEGCLDVPQHPAPVDLPVSVAVPDY